MDWRKITLNLLVLVLMKQLLCVQPCEMRDEILCIMKSQLNACQTPLHFDAWQILEANPSVYFMDLVKGLTPPVY